VGSLRTQVAIVGAGPAGLVLGHLLAGHGVEAIVLEARERQYVESRVRAGVLEQGTVDLLREMGVAGRLDAEGMVHEGVELRFAGRPHRIDFAELTGGKSITIYGQQEVVKDLIAARVDAGGPLLFEIEDVRVEGLDTERPTVRYRHDGEEHDIACDYVAGCDGFHGVCRDAVPAGALRFHERQYPYAWFGVLAEAAPSTEELVYCHSERGFALYSMRSPTLSRLYFQCDAGEDPDAWSEEEIWEELRSRLALADGHEPGQGPIIEKGVTPMRSFVAEPMQHERLFLAGDAVHIVPPTGAKGMNLAIADVRVLAEALRRHYADSDDGALEGYSEECLRRVWRTQFFSYWMTSLLHRPPDDEDGFATRLQLAQLEYVCSSRAASTMLAENYVGAVA
jgi:p-hydroxybenzoate 3-monooxygenase